METVLDQQEQFYPRNEKKKGLFSLTLREFTKVDGSPIVFFINEENKAYIAGTDPNCEIKLKEYGVGKKHISLEKIKDFILINDLGSERETHVNGIRLIKNASMFLRSGDELKLGKLTFSVELLGFDGAPSRATSPIITKKSVQEKVANAKKKMEEEIKEISEVKEEDKLVSPPPIPDENNLEIEIPTKEIIIDEVFQEKKESESHIENKKNPLPHFMVRVIGLWIDFVMTFLVFKQFHYTDTHQRVLEFFQIIINGGLALSKNPLEIASGSIVFVGISYLLFYASYSMVTTLALGVSLGQKMVGLKGDDTFLWNRIGGAIRFIFGMVTTPFIFLDQIPHLIRRRSLKEKLSMTRVIQGEPKWIPIYFSIFLLPFMALLLISPMIGNKDNKGIDKVIKYRDEITTVDISKIETSPVFPVNSHYFRFSFDYIYSDSFIFYPGFEIVKKGVFQRIHPTINFYDVPNETLGQIHAEKYIYIADDLLKVQTKIDSFHLFYPALDQYLRDNRKEIERYKGKFGENTYPQMGGDVKKDYEKLLMETLTFSIEKTEKFFKRKQFFLSGYKWFQDILMKRYIPFSSKEKIKLGLINLGGQNFFLISGQQSFKLKENARIERFLFPLETLNGILYQIGLSETPHFEKSFINLLGHLSYQLRFHFDEVNPLEKNNFVIPDFEQSKSSLFQITDYFASKSIQGSYRNKLEDILFNLYIDLGKLATKMNHQDFRLSLAKELSKVESVTNIVVKDANFHRKYLADLKSLERAIANRDQGYFDGYDEAKKLLLRDQEIDELIPDS